MWAPLLSLLQSHQNSIFWERLKEFLCVHTSAIFIQHQHTNAQYTQRVTDLSESRDEEKNKIRTVTSSQENMPQTIKQLLHSCSETFILGAVSSVKTPLLRQQPDGLMSNENAMNHI